MPEASADMNLLSPAVVRRFRKKVYDCYRSRGRDLPWRRTKNPYHILVSEVMLQQTRVDRVIEKYPAFIEAFPDFNALAKAPLADVLRLWQGMGYNRRALSLKALARKIVEEHGGKLPSDPHILTTLPGIGTYTAGAVMAFAFNKPVVCIDTNIRRVYIHEFLQDRENIGDGEIAPLIRQTLDTRNPRKWYNALMDYGSELKRGRENPNKRSAAYVRQSSFENSNRQVRGGILKALVNAPSLTLSRIVQESGMERARIRKNLTDLENEGFIRRDGRRYRVA